ncbi:MAG: hypothetical protein ACQEP1_06030 [Nanobdellota archaeon]
MSIDANPLGPHDEYVIIKNKGVADIKQLYADIRRWFRNHDYEFHEKDQKSKIPSPMGAEEELKMFGKRKEDDFIQFEIKLEIHTWDVIPVEVMKNGKKVEMSKCRAKIVMWPLLHFDYEDKFEKSFFFEGLRKWYINNIIKRRFQIQGDKLEYEFFELHDLLKRDLGMLASGDQFDLKWK